MGGKGDLLGIVQTTWVGLMQIYQNMSKNIRFYETFKFQPHHPIQSRRPEVLIFRKEQKFYEIVDVGEII